MVESSIPYSDPYLEGNYRIKPMLQGRGLEGEKLDTFIVETADRIGRLWEEENNAITSDTLSPESYLRIAKKLGGFANNVKRRCFFLAHSRDKEQRDAASTVIIHAYLPTIFNAIRLISEKYRQPIDESELFERVLTKLSEMIADPLNTTLFNLSSIPILPRIIYQLTIKESLGVRDDCFGITSAPKGAIVSDNVGVLACDMGQREFEELRKSAKIQATLEEIYNDMLSAVLHRALNSLTSRKREVLKERFGLEDGRPKTQREVGGMLGVSAGRIYEIESEACWALRHPRLAKEILEALERD